MSSSWSARDQFDAAHIDSSSRRFMIDAAPYRFRQQRLTGSNHSTSFARRNRPDPPLIYAALGATVAGARARPPKSQVNCSQHRLRQQSLSCATYCAALPFALGLECCYARNQHARHAKRRLACTKIHGTRVPQFLLCESSYIVVGRPRRVGLASSTRDTFRCLLNQTIAKTG